MDIDSELANSLQKKSKKKKRYMVIGKKKVFILLQMLQTYFTIAQIYYTNIVTN